MRNGHRGVQRLLPLERDTSSELTPEAQRELVQALAEMLLAEARNEAAQPRGSDDGKGARS
jgi:hypothetical protein